MLYMVRSTGKVGQNPHQHARDFRLSLLRCELRNGAFWRPNQIRQKAISNKVRWSPSVGEIEKQKKKTQPIDGCPFFFPFFFVGNTGVRSTGIVTWG